MPLDETSKWDLRERQSDQRGCAIGNRAIELGARGHHRRGPAKHALYDGDSINRANSPVAAFATRR